jgi:RimJ/RimL family protein N-acetyltransferase
MRAIFMQSTSGRVPGKAHPALPIARGSIETASGQAVVWCGLRDIDWQARECNTSYWVRKSAQRQGIATEAANAMACYAFQALGMRRVGLTRSAGNEASRRIAGKLGFSFEGIQPSANPLPGGRGADRCCYARFERTGLLHFDVHRESNLQDKVDPC